MVVATFSFSSYNFTSQLSGAQQVGGTCRRGLLGTLHFSTRKDLTVSELKDPSGVTHSSSFYRRGNWGPESSVDRAQSRSGLVAELEVAPHPLTAPLSLRLPSPVWLFPLSSPDPSTSPKWRLCGPAPRLKGKPAHFITSWVPLPVKIFFCALTLETVLSTKQWLKTCRIYRDAAAAQWEVVKT